jgi:hypothetical protein
MVFYVGIQVYVFNFLLNKYVIVFCTVSHKSGYIKPVREAFDFVERYYREQFIDNNNKFSTTCMESLTTAKLISELEMSSVGLYCCFFRIEKCFILL